MTTNQIDAPFLAIGVGAVSDDGEGLAELVTFLGNATLSSATNFSLLILPPEGADRDELFARLRGCTTMKIAVVTDALPIEANTIYLLDGLTPPLFEDGQLHLKASSAGQNENCRVDGFFCALAAAFGASCIGVLLADDSAAGIGGLAAIKRNGGLAIAQSGRRGNTEPMITGIADLVLPLSELPATLKRYARYPASLRRRKQSDEDRGDSTLVAPSEQDLRRLGDLLRQRTDFDLHAYKSGTVRRRVMRLMALSDLRTFEEYYDLLLRDSEARQDLIADLLISVTEFFRDPEHFEHLNAEVIQLLVAQASPGDTLRAWVPACATGQEAYSVAMLFLEAIEARAHKELSLQVFATDIDEQALRVARRGVYTRGDLRGVSEKRQAEFFRETDENTFQIASHLRNAVAFARHDITIDPPFSGMHLVSCRNVLIYLRPKRQKYVLDILHFSLERGGFLFLGSSETIARKSSLFAPVSTSSQLYRKVGSSRPVRLHRQITPTPPERYSAHRSSARVQRDKLDTVRAQRAILAAQVPPTIVVSPENEILYTHGLLAEFLQVPQGHPQMDLTSVVKAELNAGVRTVVSRARRRNIEATTIVANGEVPVRLTAFPATELTEGSVVLRFETLENGEASPLVLSPSDPEQEGLVKQLEHELQETQEDLRSAVEELESSNEELRAVHEESLSMNEELQAANEELEASSEELRSLNEELVAVNAELREKVEHLEQLHNDLNNFFASTRIATLFLDRDLHIRRFTPAAAELLHLENSDLGRKTRTMSHELLQNDLLEDVRSVLSSLVACERELQADNGRWYSRTVLPYRTTDERIIGVVVTLGDITNTKETTARLSARERQQAVVARMGLQSLESGNLQSALDQIVGEVHRTLGVDLAKILEHEPGTERLFLRAGVGWKEGLVGKGSVGTDLDSQAGYTLRSPGPVIVDDLQTETRFSGPPLLREHGVRSGISCVIRGAEGDYGVLGAHATDKRKFTTEDTDFLQSMAGVISSAVSRHYVRVRVRIESEIGRIVATAKNIVEAAVPLHEAFGQVFGASTLQLWLRDENLEQEETRFTCQNTLFPKAFRAEDCAPFLLGNGLTLDLLRAHTPFWLSVEQLQDHWQSAPFSNKPEVASGLVLPIAAGDKVLGAVAVFFEDRHVFHTTFAQNLVSVSQTLGEFLRRCEVEEVHRANEKRLEQLFESAGVMLWEQDFEPVRKEVARLKEQGITDLRAYYSERLPELDALMAKLQLLDINQETLRFFGVGTKEELLARAPEPAAEADPRTRELSLQTLEAYQRGVSLVSFQTELTGLTGEKFDVSMSVRFPASDEGPHRILVSITDITEVVKTQRELEESRRWLSRVTEAIPDVVAVLDVVHSADKPGQMVAPALLGFEEFEEFQEEERRLSLEMIHPADRELFSSFVDTFPTIADNGVEATYRVLATDGSFTWLNSRAVAFHREEGRTTQVLVAVRDVTELKRYQEELQEASEQKDRFLAMLGHELRNPLAAISTASETLSFLKSADDELLRIQALLQRQTRHMAKLLDGLLDISRIVRGKIHLEKSNVDLAEVIEDVLHDRQRQIEESGLELEADLLPRALTVEGDRVRLTQIVDNLLSNAIKFTPAPGKITISLGLEDGQAVLTFADTGMGIDEELLPHVFEVFRQSEQALDRSAGGLGLGLALVRALTELHGGEVTVESEGQNQGTTFVLRFPVTSLTQRKVRMNQTTASQHRRILLVDDNRDIADTLAALLQARGFEVCVAYDGEQALKEAEKFLPEVVLCDIGLPGTHNGYDVARSLRQNKAFASLLLIALTGYGTPEDQARTAEAGFDVHLTKPLKFEDLHKIL